MDGALLAMWRELNYRLFDGSLKEIVDIDWHALAGDDNLNAYGLFMHKVRCIAIDEQFRFDTAGVEAGVASEIAKKEISYLLVVHEMIHQALHEKGVERFGRHGAEFVEMATSITPKLGITAPTEMDAHRWPNPAALIAHYMR